MTGISSSNLPDVSSYNARWILVYSQGSFGNIDNTYNWDELFYNNKPNSVPNINYGLFIRLCNGNCASTHEIIVYNRISSTQIDLKQNTLITWASNNNVLNSDFELYSSWNDFISQSNKWLFCNYDDTNIGFPRDCGPNGGVGCQFNSYSYTACAQNYGYYVLVSNTISPLYLPDVSQYNAEWVLMYSSGTFGTIDNSNYWDELFYNNKPTSIPNINYGVLLKICNDCTGNDHKYIIYNRISSTQIDLRQNMLITFSNSNNILHTDFELYGSWHDFLIQSNKWQFCDYNDNNVGFPRNCNKGTSATGCNFNSFNTGWGSCRKVNYQYYVLTAKINRFVKYISICSALSVYNTPSFVH